MAWFGRVVGLKKNTSYNEIPARLAAGNHHGVFGPSLLEGVGSFSQHLSPQRGCEISIEYQPVAQNSPERAPGGTHFAACRLNRHPVAA